MDQNNKIYEQLQLPCQSQREFIAYSSLTHFEKLKTVLFQIIGENDFLLAALDLIKQRRDLLPSIDISSLESSRYIPDTNTIEIGVPDLTTCFRLSKLCTQEMKSNIRIKKCYLDCNYCYEKCRGINIFYPANTSESEIVEKQINNSNFLQGEEITIHDALTTYSLAYSLFHEIGHVLHNKYIEESEPIKREMAADAFAFEAIKSMRGAENSSVLFCGVFLAIINMLVKRTPQQESADEEHPHSIERLHSLLEFWGIEDESPYWELAYNIVQIWCNKNDLSITWERNTSLSFKDKFIDAYYHFRKNPK